MFYAHWTQTVPRLLVFTIDSSFLFCRRRIWCVSYVWVCAFVMFCYSSLLNGIRSIVHDVSSYTLNLHYPHINTYTHSDANILKKAMDKISTLQIKDGLLTIRKHTCISHNTQSVSQTIYNTLRLTDSLTVPRARNRKKRHKMPSTTYFYIFRLQLAAGISSQTSMPFSWF